MLFAPSRMLPRDQAEPGGKLTPIVELLDIAHRCYQRRSRQWANARKGQEPLALGMVLPHSGELLVVIDKPFLYLDELVKEVCKELVAKRREVRSFRFKLCDKCFAKLAHTGGQHHAVFAEQSSEFID
jgi:hypothetical protein